MKKSESIAEIAKALAKFQGEVKQPLKDKNNPFFKSKYVPLENVVEAITETSSKYGLSFLQFPVNEDDKVGVTTLLMHESGEWIETDPIFARPAKNDAQQVGSVITYLKRYSLSAVFGITSDEDDDANSASAPGNVQTFQTSYQPRENKPMSPTDAANMKVTFGKYNGKSLRDIYKEDKQYITWLAKEGKSPALKQAANIVLEALKQPQKQQEEPFPDAVPINDMEIPFN